MWYCSLQKINFVCTAVGACGSKIGTDLEALSLLASSHSFRRCYACYLEEKYNHQSYPDVNSISIIMSGLKRHAHLWNSSRDVGITKYFLIVFKADPLDETYTGQHCQPWNLKIDRS